MKNVQVLVLFNIHMFVLQIHSNQVENTINLLLPYHSILLQQWIPMTRYETRRKYFLFFFPSKSFSKGILLLSEQSVEKYLYFMSYFSWLQY